MGYSSPFLTAKKPQCWIHFGGIFLVGTWITQTVKHWLGKFPTLFCSLRRDRPCSL